MRLEWISEELALDTRLPSRCIWRRAEYAHLVLVDGRRAARQKRKLKKLRLRIKIAQSYKVYDAGIADNLYAAPRLVCYDDLTDEPITPEQKALALLWFEDYIKGDLNGISYSHRRLIDGELQELPYALQEHLFPPSKE